MLQTSVLELLYHTYIHLTLIFYPIDFSSEDLFKITLYLNMSIVIIINQLKNKKTYCHVVKYNPGVWMDISVHKFCHKNIQRPQSFKN